MNLMIKKCLSKFCKVFSHISRALKFLFNGTIYDLSFIKITLSFSFRKYLLLVWKSYILPTSKCRSGKPIYEASKQERRKTQSWNHYGSGLRRLRWYSTADMRDRSSHRHYDINIKKSGNSRGKNIQLILESSSSFVYCLFFFQNKQKRTNYFMRDCLLKLSAQ